MDGEEPYVYCSTHAKYFPHRYSNACECCGHTHEKMTYMGRGCPSCKIRIASLDNLVN